MQYPPLTPLTKPPKQRSARRHGTCASEWPMRPVSFAPVHAGEPTPRGPPRRRTSDGRQRAACACRRHRRSPTSRSPHAACPSAPRPRPVGLGVRRESVASSATVAACTRRRRARRTRRRRSRAEPPCDRCVAAARPRSVLTQGGDDGGPSGISVVGRANPHLATHLDEPETAKVALMSGRAASSTDSSRSALPSGVRRRLAASSRSARSPRVGGDAIPDGAAPPEPRRTASRSGRRVANRTHPPRA